MARDFGTVKWFSNKKGFGFIEREGDEDVFVHHSDIEMEGFRSLDAGEGVEFEVIQGERGPKARAVRRSDEAPASGSTRSTGEPSPPRGRASAGGAASWLRQLRRKLGFSA